MPGGAGHASRRLAADGIACRPAGMDMPENLL